MSQKPKEGHSKRLPRSTDNVNIPRLPYNHPLRTPLPIRPLLQLHILHFILPPTTTIVPGHDTADHAMPFPLPAAVHVIPATFDPEAHVDPVVDLPTRGGDAGAGDLVACGCPAERVGDVVGDGARGHGVDDGFREGDAGGQDGDVGVQRGQQAGMEEEAADVGVGFVEGGGELADVDDAEDDQWDCAAEDR